MEGNQIFAGKNGFIFILILTLTYYTTACEEAENEILKGINLIGIESEGGFRIVDINLFSGKKRVHDIDCYVFGTSVYDEKKNLWLPGLRKCF
jgi:hypothetical protein